MDRDDGGECHVCRQLKGEVNPWTFNIVTISHMQSGAAGGCRTCDLRYRVITHYSTDPEANAIFTDGKRDPPEMILNRKGYEIFKIADSSSDDFSRFHIGHFLSRSTSSEETFNTIRTWIQQCEEIHTECRRHEDDRAYMPKRVLDVRSNAVVPREGVAPAPYICLSHCWGPPNKQIIRTLSSNIHSFLKHVPWDDLSNTFQDAIDITRRLDVDYIWIDSLCIIQEDRDDWKEESVKMADIYENAFLTIAATKSRDGSGGC